MSRYVEPSMFLLFDLFILPTFDLYFLVVATAFSIEVAY
jgi:hypothetical protein